MSRYAYDNVEYSDDVDALPDLVETLEVLAAAMECVTPLMDRIVASHRSAPGEGLALLSAYLAIENLAVRQAVLDAVVTISGTKSVFG